MQEIALGLHLSLRPWKMAMVLVTPCQLKVCMQEIVLGLHLSLRPRRMAMVLVTLG